MIRGETGEELDKSTLQTTTFCRVSRSDLHSKHPENKEILEGCEAGVELEHVTLWPGATVSKFSFLKYPPLKASNNNRRGRGRETEREEKEK